MTVLIKSLETAIKSPLPRQTHWLICQGPSYRRACALKDDLVQSNLEATKARLSKADGNDDMVRCAIDHIVWREKQIADREGCEPYYNNAVIHDELFGFRFAGHDTTATTMRWAVKFLAAYPEAQSKLRSALREAYPEASAKDEVPSAKAMTKTDVPYLDGTIEEILRIGGTASAQTRTALRNTKVLGYRIPKGTEIFLLSGGSGFVEPDDFAASIPENVRPKSSQESKDKVQAWDPTDIGAWKPERWLNTREDGTTYFDPQAGPTLQFGAGVRGCQGRRL